MKKLLSVINHKEYQNICILGFGREGKSTLEFLDRLTPRNITVADQKEVDSAFLARFSKHIIHTQTGDNYLAGLEQFDLVIKSPGIKLPSEIENKIKEKLTSQAALFLEAYHKQIIGITATKGKSTTSSLTYHILKESGKKSVLVGNIGIPCFSLADQIEPDTIIVFEFSAQQLYNVKCAPHVAMFLSLFPDHIDYFGDFERYGQAKLNIVRYQSSNDVFFYNPKYNVIRELVENIPVKSQKFIVTKEETPNFITNGDHILSKKTNVPVLDFTKTALRGEHNLINLLFAIEAATYYGVSFDEIIEAAYSFQTLENRLEYVGCFAGKHFYNDSIATVPDAAVAALSAVKNIQTIILGGYDRGIDLTHLITAVAESPMLNIIFTGISGKRMMETLHSLFPNHSKKVYYFEHYENLVETAIEITPVGGVCILSPASPSFDSFNNFEERGRYFKEKVREICSK
ncbi:MAG: UDP-N-acetylmuramoyl-L-alanine--D-glutamate ligase [Bacteroidales bacterium]|jgi:UDP-N-acetylmuramoylalanine--D-glutamate ligase|nr:UDP-N-acetylmuramoyl-L-alanine--D-glutamate ligase [Bacteroidales bacterium]